MKTNIIIVSLLLLLIVISCQQTQQKGKSEENAVVEKRKSPGTPRFPSPAATAIQTVGLSTITINYSRPSVISPEGIDRTGNIWGGLVPYNFNFRPVASQGKPIPWRAGANENTTIEFSHDAKVEDQPIKAGKYGLHMAVHEAGGATVIFSKKSDGWGSFSYDEQDDALRVEVETEETAQVDRLVYGFPVVDNTYARVALNWEKKQIPFKVEFNVHDMVLTNFRQYLTDTTGLNWRDFNRAAGYCADNKVNFDEGMVWIEQSLSREENYTNLSTKSAILKAMGRNDEAGNLKDLALEHPTTKVNDFYSYGTSLIRTGRPEEAMKVYKRQREKWPEEWLTAHGLARGYSALGQYQRALQLEKEALSKAPEINKGFIESAIALLEKGKDFN